MKKDDVSKTHIPIIQSTSSAIAYILFAAEMD